MRVLLSTFLVIFSFMVTIIQSYAITEQQGYLEKTLIDGHWGIAQNEFGLRAGNDIETIGPLTFTLGNEGEIYVLDTINRHVKKFNYKGVYEGNIISDALGTAICVDSNKNLYLLDGHNIKHYSQDGFLINTYQVSNNIHLIEGYGQMVFCDQVGNLFVNRIQEVYNICESPGARRNASSRAYQLNPLTPNQQIQSKKNGLPGKSAGGRFATIWIDNHMAAVKILQNSGEFYKEIIIKTPDVFGAVLFLGQDNMGSIYVEYERITSDNYVHLEVRKYNPHNGELLASIELPNDYFTMVYKKIHLDDQGNIYQLLTTKSRVKLIKWQKK